MKKFFAAALICCIVLTAASCAKKDDFRSVSWGTTKNAVISAEGKDPTWDDENYLLFLTDMNGSATELHYVFEGDKLVSGECKFIIGDKILSEFMEEFLTLRASLTELYGEPLSDDYRDWLIENPGDYANDKDQISIFYKRLQYFAEWNTNDTRATLTLNFNNEQVNYVYFAEAIGK
ncbi:MAG: hypothetical protein RR058_00220 [Oscillospiraceae bacterium]